MTLSHLLLCTDLDRTLIPNGPQPASVQASGCLESLVSRPEVTLVFVSGRDRDLVEEAMTTYELPCPDFVIGDVGTSILPGRAQARVGPAGFMATANRGRLGREICYRSANDAE